MYLVTARCTTCGRQTNWTQERYELGTTVVEPCAGCNGQPRTMQLMNIVYDAADIRRDLDANGD